MSKVRMWQSNSGGRTVVDSVGVNGAEHTHMRGDPDRCPYDRGSADDVRSAFGRQSPGRGGDALPLINLEKRDVRLHPKNEP